MPHYPLVFFSRCKPQGVDIVDLCLEHNHIFFGWPLWKVNGKQNQDNLHEFMFDPRSDWEKEDIEGYNKQHAQNRNLAREVQQGDIALIPRPSLGCVYAGVVEEFVFYQKPPWADEYLQMRCAVNKEEFEKCDDDAYYFQHVPDVAQGWRVTRFERIPYAHMPRWILASVLGRSTYGRVKEHPLGGNPYAAICGLIQNKHIPPLAFTTDLTEIKQRLVNQLSPATFEQLCVDLLQLEYPDERWTHVGGSGDDGMDGLGFNNNGKLIGRLQCKLYWCGGDANKLFSENKQQPSTRNYFATLSPIEHKDGFAMVWDINEITSRILKYASRLPIALSLRIG